MTGYTEVGGHSDLSFRFADHSCPLSRAIRQAKPRIMAACWTIAGLELWWLVLMSFFHFLKRSMERFC